MDMSSLVRAGAALMFTLGLIWLVAYLVRRFAPHMPGLLPMGRAHANSRLEVVAAKPIDGRHIMVLVRCDAAEHLLVLSAHAAPVVIGAQIAQDQTVRSTVPPSQTEPA